MNDTEIMNSLMRIDGRSQSINMIASNRIQDLNIEIARITAERDEARRMYCRQTADSLENYREPERIAEDRNWDCFEIENTPTNSEKTGEEHLSLANQEEARQAWYDNSYGPDGDEFDDQDDYDPREDEGLDEEVDNGDLSESMNKICDKYENVFKKLSETDSNYRQHKEGAD
jgi:hypothetical protein